MLRLRIDDFAQDLVELTNAKIDMSRFRIVSIDKKIDPNYIACHRN